VLFQRQAGVGGVDVGLALRQPEVVLNELPQIEVGLTFDLAVVPQDVQRIVFRRAVGEGFAVGKMRDFCTLVNSSR
jgi:hypothetical protein